MPQRFGSHYYYTRHLKGTQYRVHCRRAITDPTLVPTEYDVPDPQQIEQALIDEDELARGHNFFDLSGPTVSPDESLLAYGIDMDGSETYALHVRQAATNISMLDGKKLGWPFDSTAGDVEFQSDSAVLLFTSQTADTRRADKVWRFRLGLPITEGQAGVQANPQLLYTEEDEAFHLSLWKSRTSRVVFLKGRSEVTDYVMYLQADDLEGDLQPLAPKVRWSQV